MPQWKSEWFWSAEGGSVSVIAAILFTALLGAVGLAIDYGVATSTRVRIQNAADAAALAAVRTAADVLQQYNSDAAYVSQAIAAGQEAGNGLFAADVANEAERPTLSIALAYDRSVFVASGTGTMTVPTMFARLVGIRQFDLGLSAQATSQLPQFTSLHLLLDVSQSMGIGATQTDMKALFHKTSCVFGCHDRVGKSKSNQEIARDLGLTLRIDSLRAAVLDLLALVEHSSLSNYFQFEMSSFDTDRQRLVPMSGNFTLLRSAAQDIDLGPTDELGPPATYLNEVVDEFARSLPDGGDGRTHAKPLRYVVLVSDGVSDTAGPGCLEDHCTGTIDPAVCRKIKDKNIGLAVIYTTYLPIYENPFNPDRLEGKYRVLVRPFASEIAARMQECASPDLYFEATDGPAIQSTFQELLGKLRVPYLSR